MRTAKVTFDGSTPGVGGTVSAQINLPTGSSQILSLFDDGSHSDGQPNDGIFGNTYTQTGAGGIFGVVVTANGVYTSVPYTRIATSFFTIAPDTASLTGQYDDMPINSDGDPAYEWLEINIGVNVAQPGTYTLSADLFVGATLITHARKTQFLINGSQTVSVLFKGVDIYNNQLNGPYTVRNVLLLDETSVTLLIEAVDNAHTTAPYSYTDFDNGIIYLYLPLVRRP